MQIDYIKNKYKNEYDIIIPFGRCCHTSMILNDLKLRKCSLPFDWLIDSENELDDIETRCKLTLDYNDFLDSANIQIYRDKSFCDDAHYLCVEQKYKFSLWHDFLKTKSDRENLVLTRFKYKRRFNRLNEILNKANKIAFVHIVNTYDHMDEFNRNVDIEALIGTLNAFAKHFKNVKIDFYLFEHSDVSSKGQIEEKHFQFNSGNIFSLSLTINIL